VAQASERLTNLMVQTKAEEQLCTENNGANWLTRSQSCTLALLRAGCKYPSKCHSAVGLNFSLPRAMHLELSSQVWMCEPRLRYARSVRTSSSLQFRHCPAQGAGCCECHLKHLLHPLLTVKLNKFNK